MSKPARASFNLTSCAALIALAMLYLHHRRLDLCMCNAQGGTSRQLSDLWS